MRKYRRRYRRKRQGRVKKMVKSIIRRSIAPPEIKYHTHAFDPGSINDSTGVSFLVNASYLGLGLSQGVTRYQRIGDSIRIKSIRVSWTTHINIACSDAPIRAILFHDRTPNGIAFSTADVLSSGPVSGETAYYGYNPYEVGKKKSRFTILKDFMYDHRLPFTDASANHHVDHRTHTIVKHFGTGLRTDFYNSPSSGTIADIESGAIWFWLIQGYGDLDESIDHDTVACTLTFTDC